MNYSLFGYNTETLAWDHLDRDVPAEEAETLRQQLVEGTIYETINIVPECASL